MNGTTRALLRRDRPLWLFFGLAGTIALAATLCVENFVHVWVLPPMSVEALFHGAWICGAALGLVAGSYDTLLRTNDYARHRPVSPARQHGTRLLGCALVILAWMVLAPLACVVWEFFTGHAAHAFSPSNLPFVWLNMLPAFSACAIGYFAGTLPVALWWRLPAGGAVLFPTFVAIDLLRRATPETNVPFALAHIALAALLAAASFAHAGTSHDADLPWAPRVRRRSAVLLAVLFALAVSLLLGMQRKNQLHDLRWQWPFFAMLPSGIQLVVQGEEDGRTQWYRCDENHHRGAPLVPGFREIGAPGVSLPRDPEIDRPRPSGDQQRVWGWFGGAVLRDGLLHLTHIGPGRRLVASVIGRDEQRTPFERGTSLWEPRAGGQRGLWLLEPGSDAVLTVAVDGTVSRLPLQDGDRLVGRKTVRRERDEDAPASQVRDHLTVLLGEKHVYALERDDGAADANPEQLPTKLTAAPAWAAAAARAPDAPPRLRETSILDADPAAPLVAIVDADGKTLFEHRFAARTGRELRVAALLFATSLAAMPVLAVTSFALAAPPDEAGPFCDFLLLGQRRPWLLVLTLLVALAVAARHRRRLLASGAAPATARLWFVLGILCGPAAWCVAALGDGARAYRRPVTVDEPAPRPRITDSIPA